MPIYGDKTSLISLMTDCREVSCIVLILRVLGIRILYDYFLLIILYVLDNYEFFSYIFLFYFRFNFSLVIKTGNLEFVDL